MDTSGQKIYHFIDMSMFTRSIFFKNKSGNSRLLVSGMKATGSQHLYVRSDIVLFSRLSVDCSIPIWYSYCMSKYIHARTCVYNLNYHIVWCVKYRRKVLDEEISSRLYGIIQEIAQEKGFHVATCKVGDMDHVHCFLSLPPKMSVTQAVKCRATFYKWLRLKEKSR